jgi:hypothetical protein
MVEVFQLSGGVRRTYIGDSGAKYQSEDNITADMLIFDSEPLCLQGANGDGKSRNEVGEDHSGISVADSLEGNPKLCYCQSWLRLVIAGRGEAILLGKD